MDATWIGYCGQALAGTRTGCAGEQRENTEIKTQAAGHIGDVRDAEMFFGVRSPIGQGGQVMGLRRRLEMKLRTVVTSKNSCHRGMRQGHRRGAYACQLQEIAAGEID